MTFKCKKCGRPIKHADSIAAGMGPICRGSSNSSRRPRGPRARRPNGQAYAAHSPLAVGLDLYLPLGPDEWEAPDGSRISHEDLGHYLELLTNQTTFEEENHGRENKQLTT